MAASLSHSHSQSHSHYLHASLYIFNEEARVTILTRFNELVNDITVQCYYDPVLDAFCLQCPRGDGDHADRGPATDAMLARIIDDYVQQETATRRAEPSNVVRFPQSLFAALDSFDEGNPSHATAPVQAPPTHKAARTHIIMVGEKEGNLVKLFPIHELDRFGLLERSLAPRNLLSEKVFSKGLTCRATVWHPMNGYVFNGRTGKDKKLLGSGDETAPLRLPEFPKLVDDRAGADPILNDVPISTWEFDGRPPTTVQRWLNGMGDMVQMEPSARPDLPKDAKKLIAQEQAHTTGRARVPKGFKIIQSDTEEDESDEEYYDDSGDKSTSGGFEALLHGGAQARRVGQEEFDSASYDDDSSDSERVQPPSFQSLLSGNKDAEPKQPVREQISDGWSRAVKASGGTPDRLRPPSKEQSAVSSTGVQPHTSRRADRSTGESLSEYIDNESWAEYGKAFARVDDIGLAGNPFKVARWDHEHVGSDQSPPKSNRGLSVMARPFRFSATANVTPSGTGAADLLSATSNATPSVSVVPSTHATNQSMRNYANWNPREAKLANRPGVVTSGSKLIDDTAPASARPARAPPGFLPLFADSRILATPTFLPVIEDKLIDVEPNLIDEEYPMLPPVTIPSRLPLGSEPTPTDPNTSYATVMTNNANDLPIDKIKTMPKDFATKLSTKHKAGRKTNGRSHSKATGMKYTAQLELPEPAPAPKWSKMKEGNLKRQDGVFQALMEGGSNVRPSMIQKDDGMAKPHLSSSRRITNENHPFGQTLFAEEQKRMQREVDDCTVDCSKVKLVCKLGMFLVRPDESCWSKLSQKSHDPLDLQSSFKEYSQDIKTDFLPRLTTAAADAKYLLELGTSGPTQDRMRDLCYEIYVRDTANSVLKVTMLNADKANVSITTSDQIAAEAAAYFAVHVWDAQFLLLHPGVASRSSSNDAIKDFITSIATDQEAPSFRAKIPNGLFSVLRVFAKRSISHAFDGMKYIVTEVQDLVCENLETRRHNFRALCLAQEDMVTEQRLWWESAWETTDLSKAGALQAKVNAMVPEMDAVGLGNQGPWIFKEISKYDEEQMEVPEIPFW